jgi:hypothetical protein
VLVTGASLDLAGAETIRATGSIAGGTFHLVRQTITIPQGRILRARIRFQVDNAARIYINGTLIATASPPVDTVPTFTVTVDPAVLAPGTNVIATRIENFLAGGPMGVRYLLEINY